MSAETIDRGELLALTADIVTAFVGNNSVATADLPSVITDVFAKLSGLSEAPAEPTVELTPAVPIKKSITPAAIVCLECGRKMKMLKRHLSTNHNQTVDDYRARWGLSHDYPMVAPNYSEQRQMLAKKIGLGRKAAGAKPKRSKKG